MVSQVERVLDLTDINFLRRAQRGEDINYKVAVWNLSQNVDRETGSSKVGICPCLTPSGVPYVTNRGGPVIGIEALSLQGIPVDDLILTRESDENMKDLAGNAMACTVVGSCIAHSLVLAMKHNVFELPDEDTKKNNAAMLKASSATTQSGEQQRFLGEDSLVKSEAAVSTGAVADVPGLIAEARRSARMCVCEGRAKVAAEVLTCAACGHTACAQCAGKPEHEYGAARVTPSDRVNPSDFLARLKRALPMVVRFDAGVGREELDRCKPAEGCDDVTWAGWTAAFQVHNSIHLEILLNLS